jgi:polyhydroxyalkanoate synthesis regulator phasin
MAMFKGISQGDLLTAKPRLMCAILSEQLALTNTALEAMSEEIKMLRAKVEDLEKKDKE